MKVETRYVITPEELQKVVARYIESVNDLVYVEPDEITYGQDGQGKVFAMYNASI